MTDSTDYILKVSNLKVELQNQVILEHVNFKLKKGSTLAIVGPNGAGKTMLFRALLNLVPYTGKVEWSPDIKIGYVPQNVFVKDIPISVKEFLSYRNGSNIENTLSSVKLEDASILEKTLGVLSGGQLRLDGLKKEKKITMILITHDIHLVMEYTDKLLGLNKCVTFFGESKDIIKPAMQHRIYGERVCLGDELNEV
ncbi:MAG: ATP-binding cassette domain-containing protein [Ignavibacteriaceae bacterium]